ncbi:ATP-binding protein [Adhaeretor mobilis]|uniref:histidine kinase n=1 Tax=Adhaeretor mobilis TaxID=1930276 RepID=A0A517MZM6_9BACT|nr:ATP-binding protein [Adhaeretor mobilis]QDT00333.1 Histidine protein kinase DivJ [Adhaeretor mobilis]
MSYRTFKRALGETSLERKCRLLFGTCLSILVFGTFYLYADKTSEIVSDSNRFVGKVLVDSVISDSHKDLYVTPGGVKIVSELEQKANEELTKLLRSRKFNWSIRHPKNPKHIGESADNYELDLMEQWQRASKALTSDEDVEEVYAKTDSQFGRGKVSEDGLTYIYYQAIHAGSGCITCHAAPFGEDFVDWPDMKVGDLLAIVRVEMDTKDAQAKRAENIGWLWTLGVATVFFSMAALYVIVRYVIVKPLEHLRDVSNAVRRGDVEQRADIHTGDEFEELGAAFNRMLRQLLRQQDELQDINSELDGKLDELAQANMRLHEMNQLKSDFLATVSHELRTPLNSIIGFSDLLRTNKQLEEKYQRYASNIQTSGKSLLEMINDILDLAKIESGRMELRLSDLDIGSVVLTQCDMARPLSEKKRIDLDCEIAPGLPSMRQDRGKLEQILNNLLSNAIKFTPDGGRIHVSVRQDSQGDLRLTVVDTGIGISESEQVLVFEKFRQGTTVLPDGNAMTREYSGTGLGLSIVRELCRLLGGDITLESELGNGSEFTVILPWSISEHTRIESPLAAELKLLTKPRYEPAVGSS